MIKNITLSAEEKLIKKARLRARKENRSLNEIFREWLARYVSQDGNSNYQDIMVKLSYVKPGGKFSRDDLNER
jgi:hypothetical protein